jgi:adenosylcobinamide kinase / adenosylcobinamide-phosphate guanylyltransferase
MRSAMGLVFVTGPVRSGKSAFGVRLATESGLEVTYVATASRDPDDAEWRARLERHMRDRPKEWRTVETAALSLDGQLALFRDASAGACLLVDALGTWLASRIDANIELLNVDYGVLSERLDGEAAALSDAMLASPAQVIVVGEQVGWDVVPTLPSARLFRDSMGRMGQRVARRADRIYLVVAGHAIDLRAVGTSIES